jgi:long-chain acyl-CoA synthetase
MTWADQNGLGKLEYVALTQHEKVRQQVEGIVNKVNEELASFEEIKKFAILDRDFSIEDGELTPKLSLKRKVVNSKYGHLLDEFYGEKY